MKKIEHGSTRQYLSPTWGGTGFVEKEANDLWVRLPQTLRDIAFSEISSGNVPASILENKEKGIVLLAFKAGPLHKLERNEAIRVHTEHKHGNYCYDDTNATYEDLVTGCFLAFDKGLVLVRSGES